MPGRIVSIGETFQSIGDSIAFIGGRERSIAGRERSIFGRVCSIADRFRYYFVRLRFILVSVHHNSARHNEIAARAAKKKGHRRVALFTMSVRQINRPHY
jgi:hypothetical protein